MNKRLGTWPSQRTFSPLSISSHFPSRFFTVHAANHDKGPIELRRGFSSAFVSPSSLSPSPWFTPFLPCSISLSMPLSHTLSLLTYDHIAIKDLRQCKGDTRWWKLLRGSLLSQRLARWRLVCGGGGASNTRGHSIASKRCTAASDHFYCQIKVPTSSS